jgi:hypothetical protein
MHRDEGASGMPHQKSTMPDLPTLCLKLKDARQEVQNLVVISMRPDLQPAKNDLVLKLLESCRAEVKLRLKALAHGESLHREAQPAPPPATASTPSDDRLKAAILLGLQMAEAEARHMLAMKTQQA